MRCVLFCSRSLLLRQRREAYRSDELERTSVRSAAAAPIGSTGNDTWCTWRGFHIVSQQLLAKRIRETRSRTLQTFQWFVRMPVTAVALEICREENYRGNKTNSFKEAWSPPCATLKEKREVMENETTYILQKQVELERIDSVHTPTHTFTYTLIQIHRRTQVARRNTEAWV